MISLISKNNNHKLEQCDGCSINDMLIESLPWKSVCFYVSASNTNPRVGRLENAYLWNTKADKYYVIDTLTISIAHLKDMLESKLVIGYKLDADLGFLFNYGIAPKRIYDIDKAINELRLSVEYNEPTFSETKCKIDGIEHLFFDYEKEMWSTFNKSKLIGKDDKLKEACEFSLPTAWAKWTAGVEELDVFNPQDWKDNIEEMSEKRQIITKLVKELCIP